ncbi:MAG: bifunctional diguanylate cyclase/phosphodiesterase [Nocardioidaceae bacterium]
MRWGQRTRQRPTAVSGVRTPRDEATGLVTYAGFLHEVADALAAPGGDGGRSRPAVLLVDLEGIDETSLTHGHDAGDELMRVVAGRVARELGSLGTLARMADHQVGVLFEDLADPAVALDLAYRIVTAVSSPAVLDSQRRVVLSAGCGLVTRDVLPERATASDLVRAAGLAVREAGRDGRNRIEVATAEMVADADETLAIGKDLRKALQEQGLNVCYQPLVDLTHRSVLGFEALVRWSHPVRGQVSPARFVPVAEELGLISELGRMVLSTASAQVQRWSTTFSLPLDAHVNVSGQDLRNDGFVAMVQECLEGSGLPPSQLVLEVTEATVAPDLEVARSRFEALHDLGVRVALDDFGTGRSALAYLQTLTVDILKVDRTYLESIDEQHADGRRGDDLLRGVIGLGQALGIKVYGEGIEDDAQRRRLVSSGCEIGQGYLFARPLPADEAVAMLLQHREQPLSLGARILAADAAQSA